MFCAGKQLLIEKKRRERGRSWNINETKERWYAYAIGSNRKVCQSMWMGVDATRSAVRTSMSPIERHAGCPSQPVGRFDRMHAIVSPSYHHTWTKVTSSASLRLRLVYVSIFEFFRKYAIQQNAMFVFLFCFSNAFFFFLANRHCVIIGSVCCFSPNVI